MTESARTTPCEAIETPRYDRRLIRSAYCPPTRPSQWQLEQLVGHDRVRYFGFGRHALAAALRVAGVTRGDTVLLPAYICREVLAALHATGATPSYYPVNTRLEPDCDVSQLPAAKAVIAVDYFGFPQDLAPFERYCSSSGAALIEDNAHGLFSRDARNQPLGARGDIGVFSLRKTLPAANGAAVTVNKDRFTNALEPQLAWDNTNPPSSYRVKQNIRKIVSLTGPAPARAVTAAVRTARWLRSGHRIPPSQADAEMRMPEGAAPSSTLRHCMANVDVAAESARRRRLYALVNKLLDPSRYVPLFDALPDNVVPYGYPFRADAATAACAAGLLAAHGLECFRWPELPDAIAPVSPPHYQTVWLAGFLW